MRRTATALLSSSLALMAFCAAPAAALDIYEPDSRFTERPNALLRELGPGQEAQARVRARGFELVAQNPQFATALLTMENGQARGDVYVRLQRVFSFRGDDGSRADQVAEALNKAHQAGNLRADRILPGRRGNAFVVQNGATALLEVDDAFAKAQGGQPTTLVIGWVNKLRTALGGQPFATTASRGGAFLPSSRLGHASWYGPGFHGRMAASGERFNQFSMTAAHKTLPFGTLIMVTNTSNGRSCIVRVNDRGPYIAGREIDLSYAAAQAIGMNGVASVRLDVLRP